MKSTEHSRTFQYWLITFIVGLLLAIVQTFTSEFLINEIKRQITGTNNPINEHVKPGSNVPVSDTNTVVVDPYLIANPPASTIKFSISGTSLENLREKIKSESGKMMKNRNYYPGNAFLDINSLSFNCDLVLRKSEFTKIVLVFGPINKGCESCSNVLSKNPGSVVLKDITSSTMIYNIIAIHE